MLENYFGIAFRNIARHKVFAAINISGLAIDEQLAYQFCLQNKH